jgi:hypothetical protein
MEFIMRRIALVIAFMIALAAPAVAQKAKIEAVNTKWMELFNKGDFEGVAQLYTVDAIAFPPGLSDGERQSCDRHNVERYGGASKQPESHYPRSQAIGPFGST